MTTQTLILISYLAIITVLSHLMRKWCVGILLIIPVPFIVQLTANLGCLWFLAVVVLTILDIRIMCEKSAFIKYNPMVEGCKLPKGCILAFFMELEGRFLRENAAKKEMRCPWHE